MYMDVVWLVSLMFGRYDCGTAWLKQLCTRKQQSAVLANGPVNIYTTGTNPVSDIVKEFLYSKYSEAPPYHHPVSAVTSLAAWTNAQSFSYLKNPLYAAAPLIRQEFCGLLVTAGLTAGYRCILTCYSKSQTFDVICRHFVTGTQL